jgi:hypothetical protein
MGGFCPKCGSIISYRFPMHECRTPRKKPAIRVVAQCKYRGYDLRFTYTGKQRLWRFSFNGPDIKRHMSYRTFFDIAKALDAAREAVDARFDR